MACWNLVTKHKQKLLTFLLFKHEGKSKLKCLCFKLSNRIH